MRFFAFMRKIGFIRNKYNNLGAVKDKKSNKILKAIIGYQFGVMI